ncbi:MAG: hypothetical protein ACXACU_09015 [Candidatus Hodarchaeales archaeon]
MIKSSESEKRNFKQSELVSELDGLKFMLEESKVNVKFIQEFSGFSYEGFKIPRTTKGSRTDIPFFIAEILHSHSIIDDFKDEIPTSLQDLTALLRSELRSGELQSVHQFLHLIMKEFILSDEVTGSSFSELENKRRKAKFNQLTLERISKLVKMTDTKITSTRKKGNMTASEEVIFNKIVDLVQFWKDEFIRK